MTSTSALNGLPPHVLWCKVLLLLSLLIAPAAATSDEATAPSGENNKPVAIVHVGPAKTGTTTIQSAMSLYVASFRKDSYLIADNERSLHCPGGTRTTSHIASCLKRPPKDERCDRDCFSHISGSLLDPTNDVRGYNIIISREAFDSEYIDIAKMKELLQGWDVRVVVAYRRFYDWMHSHYTQTRRVDIPHHEYMWPVGPRTNSEFSIQEWLTIERVDMLHSHYTTRVASRYREVFGHDGVSILNLYDHAYGDDIVEKFFCHHVPDAPNACRSFRRHTAKKQGDLNIGPSTSYDEVAVAAYQAGLLGDGTTVSRTDVGDLVRARQEGALGLTAGDFPKACLSPEVLDRLLNLSLESELEAVPYFYATPGGEEELRRKFAEASTSKLCGVDTDKVLADAGWMAFFQQVRDGEYIS